MGKKKENKELKLWDTTVKLLISLSVFAILTAFIAPWLVAAITPEVQWDHKEAGYLDYFLEGLATPFLAIAGILGTFLAFYMQLRANQIQIKNFQKEIKLQKQQNNINQFEGKFYEMIRLHKENVKEIKLMITERNSEGKLDYKEVNGRDVFQYLENELRIIYNFILKEGGFKGKEFDTAYHSFFFGAINSHAFDELTPLVEEHASRFLEFTEGQSEDYFYKSFVIAKYKILQGHENKLGHYYRHLFQTVKFVADQKKTFLKYKRKRNYLNLLRAQLSNYEQLMLFYNYVAYAPEWEEGNKFFSDYRMVHNLNRNLILDSIIYDGERELIKEFDKLKVKEKTARKCKDPDPIFDIEYI
ncbi:putative phage abortive infection protein [Salegentibacter sp. F188]|uniref:Phage abortive infection protein n=1 Tax=Autumnicola patrickiae TaxID=3075591 RepID=A0ABU3E524_9FLAO|nr:putative phage abortive infection protein [Salegentibacter sp. F188]MDT0691106.1 putative phage abortive infection protein [Salegentibacter sp. F188]